MKLFSFSEYLVVILHFAYTVCPKKVPFRNHSIILDLHVGHVGGEVQKNILSILLWASAVVGELHCLVIPERLVASQELLNVCYYTTENLNELNMNSSSLRQDNLTKTTAEINDSLFIYMKFKAMDYAF